MQCIHVRIDILKILHEIKIAQNKVTMVTMITTVTMVKEMNGKLPDVIDHVEMSILRMNRLFYTMMSRNRTKSVLKQRETKFQSLARQVSFKKAF